MHETVIAQQIVRVVRAELESRGATAVRTIDVDIGQLEGLTVLDLQRAFTLAAEGTPVEGAVLNVSMNPAKAFCPSCNQERPLHLPESHFEAPPPVACPECGAALELFGGRGFVVRNARLVLEDP